MASTLSKPRWTIWENACLKKAFKEKIQHKIMALALGKTVPAVSKKIKTLGLRFPSSLRGRIKGTGQALAKNEKNFHDVKKMLDILKTYAPLSCFQEGKLALKKGPWANVQHPLIKDAHKESLFCSINYPDFPFSCLHCLDFISSEDSVLSMMRSKQIREPAYIPLCYVEQWANAEGFHRTKGTLYQRGLAYWKDGTYFSHTQLLMHVNRLRFEHNLRPLALIEEEKEPII